MLYSDILYAAIAKFILTILTASNCVCNRFFRYVFGLILDQPILNGTHTA